MSRGRILWRLAGAVAGAAWSSTAPLSLDAFVRGLVAGLLIAGVPLIAAEARAPPD